MRDAELLGLSEKAKTRLRWLAHYFENGESVTATCRHFGIPRMTFYRMFERFDPTDPQSLENSARKTPQSALTAPQVISLIRAYRVSQPLAGKERIAELLLAEHGVTVSASTVGRVIEREGLYFAETPLHLRKRGGEAVPMPPLVTAHSHDHAGCAGCARAAARRRSAKRTLVVGSVLANVALLAALAFSLFVEPAARTDVRADVSAEPLTISDFLRP